MVVSQPLVDSRHRRIRMKKILAGYYIWVAADTNQTLWFSANPISGSLPQPKSLFIKLVFIKRHMIAHDVIRCSAELVAQCFNRNDTIAFGFFSLIESLGL